MVCTFLRNKKRYARCQNNPKNGFGGIGGDYIKPTALANVHAFYQRLNPSIQIIGTGGVKS
ncbi:hypothetical protein MXZ36_09950, partial [Streptococcus uberis]|nr:hypothetical protein [Streptococcus uberis]